MNWNKSIPKCKIDGCHNIGIYHLYDGDYDLGNYCESHGNNIEGWSRREVITALSLIDHLKYIIKKNMGFIDDD